MAGKGRGHWSREDVAGLVKAVWRAVEPVLRDRGVRMTVGSFLATCDGAELVSGPDSDGCWLVEIQYDHRRHRERLRVRVYPRRPSPAPHPCDQTASPARHLRLLETTVEHAGGGIRPLFSREAV